MIKRLLFLCFISLNGIAQAAQPEDHLEIVASAGPMIKKIAKVFDEKVADSIFITFCANCGAKAGTSMSIALMEKISAMTGGSGRFNMNERFEDDLGKAIGAVAGYHIGKYIVFLRHKLTDPFFFQLYGLSEATLNACKTLCENSVTYISNYASDKMRRATNYLNDYAQKKEQ